MIFHLNYTEMVIILSKVLQLNKWETPNQELRNTLNTSCNRLRATLTQEAAKVHVQCSLAPYRVRSPCRSLICLWEAKGPAVWAIPVRPAHHSALQHSGCPPSLMPSAPLASSGFKDPLKPPAEFVDVNIPQERGLSSSIPCHLPQMWTFCRGH